MNRFDRSSIPPLGERQMQIYYATEFTSVVQRTVHYFESSNKNK